MANKKNVQTVKNHMIKSLEENYDCVCHEEIPSDDFKNKNGVDDAFVIVDSKHVYTVCLNRIN